MWLKREHFEVFSKGWKWHKSGIIGKALWLPCWLNKKASSFPSKNLRTSCEGIWLPSTWPKSSWCFQRGNSFLRPCLYGEKLSRERGSPSQPSQLQLAFIWEKSWPLCPSQQRSRMLWLSRLDRVDLARRAKVFIWRKVGPARRVTLPSKKGDLVRQVTLPVEPTFCFSCKWFAKFCKEM